MRTGWTTTGLPMFLNLNRTIVVHFPFPKDQQPTASMRGDVNNSKIASEDASWLNMCRLQRICQMGISIYGKIFFCCLFRGKPNATCRLFRHLTCDCQKKSWVISSLFNDCFFAFWTVIYCRLQLTPGRVSIASYDITSPDLQTCCILIGSLSPSAEMVWRDLIKHFCSRPYLTFKRARRICHSLGLSSKSI